MLIHEKCDAIIIYMNYNNNLILIENHVITSV